ncbi:alpha/beta hydrolase [Patescibacteria group bacterium AH-259-L05]|nr:alpha/beta hydrolase [Patescibacteria group bacterium AH-259-L05]
MTKLVEFKNHKGEVLRGLLDTTQSRKGVIFLHGFERTTIEPKFKNIADTLKGEVNLFRFDFSGTGLSDGRFEDISAQKLAQELKKAIFVFKRNCKGLKNIMVIGHSFAACIILEFIMRGYGTIHRTIFLAPPLNHKEVLKYLFTFSQYKKDAGTEITWRNFKKYFNQQAYEREFIKPKRMMKAHYVFNTYYLENRDKDYQDYFKDLAIDLKSILIVHGDSDTTIPIESNDQLPRDVRVITVKKGDHDLQRPDMVTQYLNEVIKFIKK